eukprot:gene7101-6722_t
MPAVDAKQAEGAVATSGAGIEAQKKAAAEAARKKEKFEKTQLFYSHVFPAVDIHRWLSYGDDEYFKRREFSFTIPIRGEEIYTRFRSFENVAQLCQKFREPLGKMDISVSMAHVGIPLPWPWAACAGWRWGSCMRPRPRDLVGGVTSAYSPHTQA